MFLDPLYNAQNILISPHILISLSLCSPAAVFLYTVFSRLQFSLVNLLLEVVEVVGLINDTTFYQ